MKNFNLFITVVTVCLILLLVAYSGHKELSKESTLEIKRDEVTIEAFEYGYICAGSSRTKTECLNKLKEIIDYKGEVR